jgi:hypothetical protein
VVQYFAVYFQMAPGDDLGMITFAHIPGGVLRLSATSIQPTGYRMVIMMADESDDVRDAVRYWELLNNRLANFFIRVIFNIPLNDTTNAFKAYRRTVIQGCEPLIAPHFNLTVEIPLKAIVRGYSRVVIPLTWRNRRLGVPKLKIKEVGSATSLSAPAPDSKNISAGVITGNVVALQIGGSLKPSTSR